MLIRKNLYDFLSASRTSADDWSFQWIWIDQICIDQGFHEERCHQVGQMGKLYRTAEATIVWPHAAPTEQSQIVRPVDKRGWTIPITAVLDMQEVREEFDTWLPVGELDSDKLVRFLETQTVDSIYDHISSQYWWRVWIIQEITLAQQVHVSVAGCT